MAALVALLLLDTHVKMPTFTLLDAERCESGRIDMLGKHASRQRDRGFESHPLRHRIEPCKVEKACALELPSRTDAVGFERGGSRGRGSPAWGDTRGRAPSVGTRERDFECPPSSPSTFARPSPRESRGLG